ncbi:MAG: hypothetical protein RMM17_00520 [Acidobacteriota bacterium]|nr:hypothetical protein [Blastocatellia bacterium]MDW8411150.1 hypothetical protein [Acidobacteriota bacterium]
MPTLTGIEVVDPSKYIFSLNRLSDCISASFLVNWAIDTQGALAGFGKVIKAGRTVLLEFPDIDKARIAVTIYTRRVYDGVPGLEVIATHNQYESGCLAQAIAKVYADLESAKLGQVPQAVTLGLSVTATCQITGLPAVDLYDGLPLSKKALRLRDQSVYLSALEQMQQLLDDNFAFPRKINDLSQDWDDSSVLGVVYIETVEPTSAQYRSLSDNEIKKLMQEISAASEKSSQTMVKSIIARAVARIDIKQAQLCGTPTVLEVKLKQMDDKLVLPLYPLIVNRNTLVLVCDGRIALDLAETAIRATKCSVCAGVALVPAYASLGRAYELARALHFNAKLQGNGGYLDWHVGLLRPTEDIASMRHKNYSVAGQPIKLTCRPYRIGSPDAVESWSWVSRTLLGTAGLRGLNWQHSLKKLSSAVHQGPEGIRKLKSDGLMLPAPLEQYEGFIEGRRTPLLDAIEISDLYLLLD